MKNRTTAAILALFLGGIGMHKFYLGQWVWGLVYLLFCWTFIPAFFGLIEAVVLFSMSDAKFQQKYGSSGVILMTASGPTMATPETHVRCPDCREFVLRDARKCKHCGSALVPQ